MSLQNKIAVVTGGATGLGFATAKELASRGAQVIITGRRRSKLDEAVGLLGTSVTASQVDVTKVAELDRFFAKIKEKHGRIDILVANAGGVKLFRCRRSLKSISIRHSIPMSKGSFSRFRRPFP